MKLFLALAAFPFLFFSTSVYATDFYGDDRDPTVEVVGGNGSDPFADFDGVSYAQNYNEDYQRNYSDDNDNNHYEARPVRRIHHVSHSDYSRLPQTISTSEKVIIVDPVAHAWGAYSASGKLLRSGLVTAGSNYCRDLHRPCRTRSGTFRIHSLGDSSCVSSKFPLGEGGAPMPYCMYFNGAQALHGSYEVVAGNISHGCVRMHVDDARWVRFNFATIGTKVIIRPY